MTNFKRQLTEYTWLKERFSTMPNSEQGLLRVITKRLKETEERLELAEHEMTEEILAALQEEMIAEVIQEEMIAEVIQELTSTPPTRNQNI